MTTDISREAIVWLARNLGEDRHLYVSTKVAGTLCNPLGPKAADALRALLDRAEAAEAELANAREALEKAKFTYDEWWKDDHYEAIVPLRAVSKIIDAALSSTPPASAPDITETFDIDAQLTAARTEGRREGLREAIRVARIHAQYPVTGDYNRGYDKARKDAVRAIEALADQEPAP